MAITEPPYVPIVLQYKPAVISSNTTVSTVHSSYKLLITQEATSNYSTFQVLPQEYVVTIPTNGLLKLKLFVLEADRFKQTSIYRYKVYYYTKEGELLDEQYWVVPNVNLPKQTLTIENTDPAIPISMPDGLYEITNITPEVNYSLIDNMLYFDNSAALGKYTVQYQPGLTLYEIVVPQ